MYILANLTCPLDVRLHNLISMNIFFTIKDHSFSLAFFFIIVKRKPKKRLLLKSGPGPWKTWTLKKKTIWKILLTLIQLIWMTQFFFHHSRHVATAFVYIACVTCSNKRIEKSYDAISLGMISKIKTTRHTSELQ